MTDSVIVSLFEERNENALQLTQSKYGAYCKTVARNILLMAEDADECVNTVLLKAWNSIPPAKPDNLKAFLCKITRNTALDTYSRNTAAKRGSGVVKVALCEVEDIICAKNSIEQTIDNKFLVEKINQFLSLLPKEQRIIFLKRYLYFYGINDIAKELGITESKVKSVLFRLRKALKAMLEKECDLL